MEEEQEQTSTGLALSGGGHRATIFCLGALLYFVDTGLNSSVWTISSVSGGSILNGYLGLLRTKFNRLTREEFGDFASRLASQIAGDPLRWKHTCLFTSIALLLLAPLSTLLLSFALQTGIAVLVVVMSALVGRKSGGTLWAWWGTWAYLSAISWAFLAALTRLFCRYWLEGTTSWGAAAVTLLCAVAFTQRSAVASLAFGASVCRLARNTGAHTPRLEDLNAGVEHLICATEMHSGQHVFFSRGFVYSPGIGVGQPGRLPLRAAIQASANMPVAFPFRLLRTSRFRFGVWDGTRIKDGPYATGMASDVGKIVNIPTWLRLCDGGVFDNLGVSWFLTARCRFKSIESQRCHMKNIITMGRLWQNLPERVRDVEEMIRVGESASLALFSPSRVIVINGGKAPTWRNHVSSSVPGLREFFEAREVAKVMYDNTQSERLCDLRARFAAGNPPGAVIDMAEIGVEPRLEDCVGEVEKRRDRFLEQVPWSRELIDDLDRLTGDNSAIPTTLRPLGAERTADLLYHGYLQAMVSLHIKLGSPLLPRPERSRFEAMIR